MEEIRRKRAVAIGLRAQLPLITRIVALFVLIAGVVFVAVSYYRLRNNKPFMMASKATELSKEETGRVEGSEQKITKAAGFISGCAPRATSHSRTDIMNSRTST